MRLVKHKYNELSYLIDVIKEQGQENQITEMLEEVCIYLSTLDYVPERLLKELDEIAKH